MRALRYLVMVGLVGVSVWAAPPAFATSINSNPVGAVYNAGEHVMTVADSSSDFARLAAQPARIWAEGDGASGLVTALDSVGVAGPAGELGLSVTEAIGADGAAAAVVGCAVSVVCIGAVGAATAVGAVLINKHMTADGKGGIQFDPGQPATQQQNEVYYTRYTGGETGTKFPTAGAACAGIASAIVSGQAAVGNSSYSLGTQQCVEVQAGPPDVWQFQYTGCALVYGQRTCDDPANPSVVDIGSEISNTPVCQAVGGASAAPQPYPDGTCPSTPADISADDARGKLQDNTLSGPLKPVASLTAAVAAAIAGGVSTIGTPIGTSGPASQSGPSTQSTTTNPDGSSTTTTSSPTYTYKYEPSQVDVTTTTATTSTSKDADGNTTSSTSTTTSVGPGGSGTGTTGTGTGTSTGTGGDSVDPCSLHPDALGCDTLGTPGTDGPTWDTRTVNFAPEDIGMPSGCPAPRVFTVHGITFALNYEPACDVAPVIRAGLIAITALGCGLWIMQTVRA